MGTSIGDRYPDLLRLRAEGLTKVGARLTDDLERPRSRCFLPSVWSGSVQTAFPSLAIGGLRVGAVGPTFRVAEETLRNRPQVKVLDIGCAAGRFRDYLQLRDPARIVSYVGVDIAPPAVDFPVYPNLGAVPERDFDLILMSEVAEHMPADVFVESYLARLPALLAPGGVVIVSVPNPICPTVLERDVTHVQHYPWYDLYAMLRWYFESIDVLRTHFVSSPRRLLMLPLRRMIAYALEVDWCEGLVFHARKPMTQDDRA